MTRSNELPDDPDAPASVEEQAAAAALASRLESSTSLAPHVDVDDLATLAAVIRASAGAPVALANDVQRRVVEGALTRAMPGGVTSIAEARARRSRRPVVYALGGAIAAAAGVLLAIRLGGVPTVPVPPPMQAKVAAAPVPASWHPRPADALVGEIAPAAADQAGARIDLIFGDRMAAFRERTLAPTRAR